MNHNLEGQSDAITKARKRFVYLIVSMMLIAGTTDWFGAVFVG